MKAVIAGRRHRRPDDCPGAPQVGIEAEVFEQAAEVRELGVGINMLPHAVKQLRNWLLSALDRVGIRSSRLVLMTRLGQTVWDEPRGWTPATTCRRSASIAASSRACCIRRP